MAKAPFIWTTRCTVVCPACGHRGIASWTRKLNWVKCRDCGEKFNYLEHTYRPVTGGMTDEERRRHRLEVGNAWRAAHREEVNAQARDRYRANREKEVARSHRYYEAHREEVNERSLAYYHAHKEECLARQRRYREEHREELRKKKKAYRVAKWRAENRKKNR